MKRSLTIAALTVALLTLLAACGREAAPTANPGPASSTAQDLVPPSPRQIEATPQPAFPRLEPPLGHGRITSAAEVAEENTMHLCS